jgi:hypothetical protein
MAAYPVGYRSFFGYTGTRLHGMAPRARHSMRMQCA